MFTCSGEGFESVCCSAKPQPSSQSQNKQLVELTGCVRAAGCNHSCKSCRIWWHVNANVLWALDRSTGTDFYDVYTGVGARRIRETFEMLRNFAPAVLFIDEFDALGAARGAAAAGDESASIINEMLVQVGFNFSS